MLGQALKCGLTVAEFWQMTPRETFMAIEAYLWRYEREVKDQIRMAWLNAALVRAKHLPPLARLLAGKAKPLRGAELQKRRQEFEEMTRNMKVLK